LLQPKFLRKPKPNNENLRLSRQAWSINLIKKTIGAEKVKKLIIENHAQ